MRLSALLALAVFLGGAERVTTPDTQNTAVPVFIELFTSEGCSSCPPADKWLEKMDTSQPIPGAQAIVLSEHVDYWNHDGWKDPYSSSQFTERQSNYVRSLGLSGAYTPLLVVDGESELRLSDPKQSGDVLQKSVAAPMIPVTISQISEDASTPGQLRTHIDVDGRSVRHNADVYAAIALDHAESQVLRGENSGHRLSHVSVLSELRKIGKLEKGGTFSQDFQTKVKPGTDLKNLRLIVFLQEPQEGKVLGAALRECGK
jgi:hypothetical protein